MNVQYSSSVFSKSNPPASPQTGRVDFLASQYPTPIPSATDFSPTVFPLSSLRKTTHLPVEICGGQKFILAS